MNELEAPTSNKTHWVMIIVIVMLVVLSSILIFKPQNAIFNINDNNAEYSGPKLSKAYTNAFTINAYTEYGLTSNTIYIDVTENLGKNQIINISNIFSSSKLTDKISYDDIMINMSYPYLIYDYANVSIGKYSKSNISYYVDGNGTQVNTTHYYLSNDTELICDYLLSDKSCQVRVWSNVKNETRYDYKNIPNDKTKIKLEVNLLEFKNGGISLPKNGKIQLKYTYKHPMINSLADYPSVNINKYDIEVCSADGVDCSILDPTWWNSTVYSRTRLISNLTANLSHFNISTQVGMLPNFCDVVFTDSTNTTVLNFTIRSFVSNASAIFSVNTLGANSIMMYYSNLSAVNCLGNVTILYNNPVALFTFENTFNSTINGYNGIEKAGTTFNTTGKIFSAGLFNNHYILYSDLGRWFNGTNQWTVAGFEYTPGQAGNYQQFWGAYGTGTDYLGSIGYYTGDKFSEIRVALTGSGARYTNETTANGAWHYDAAARDSNKVLKIFDNAMATYDYTGTVGNYTNFNFGQWTQLTSQEWVGGMDEVAIYNRNITIDEHSFLRTQKVDIPVIGAELILPSGNATDVPYYTALTVLPASPVTYSMNNIYRFNSTWNDAGGNTTLNVTFYFDGNPISTLNSSSVYYTSINNISAGTHSYYWNATDQAGFSNKTTNTTYVINKATPTGSITVLPSLEVLNGTVTNVSGIESNLGDGDVYYNLTRDGVEVSNPDVQTFLTNGTRIYIFTAQEGQNYSLTSLATAELSILDGSLTWPTKRFNNSLSTENLTFSNAGTKTRYLAVPNNVNFVTKGIMNLSGYAGGYRNVDALFATNKYYTNTTNLINTQYYDDGLFELGTYINAGTGTATFYENTSYINNTNLPINWTFSASYCYRPVLGYFFFGEVYYWNYTKNDYQFMMYSNCNKTFSTTPYNTALPVYVCIFTIPNDGINWTNNYTAIKTILNHTAGTGSSWPAECGGAIGFYFEGKAVFNQSSVISNLNVSVGNKSVYYYSGDFVQNNNRTTNFYSAINSYLSSCNNSGGYCYVPINFYSASAGMIVYSDMYYSSSTYAENGLIYNSSVYETQNQTATYNISYDKNLFISSSASLTYDKKVYTTTKSGTAGNDLFTSIIDIPLINSSTQNKTLYFTVYLTNNTGSTEVYNSSLFNQTINSIMFDRCNTTNNVNSVNYTIYNETSLTSIVSSFKSTFWYYLGSGTIKKNVSVDLSGNSSYTFCISPNATYYTDASISLISSGYLSRNYFLNNKAYSNVVTNESLYLLDSAIGRNVILEFKDTSLKPLAGYYIETLRRYDNLGIDISIHKDKTDNFGQVVENLVENTAKYKFKFYDPNGNLIKSTSEYTIVACRYSVCIISFVNDAVNTVVGFKNLSNYDYALYFDNVTNTFIYSWNDNTGSIPNHRLLVKKTSNLGDITVCNSTSNLLISSLSCYVGGNYSSYSAQAFRYASPEKRIAILNIQVGDITAKFGIEGLFWSFILLMLLITIGIWYPPVGVGLYIVGFILLKIVGVLHAPPEVIIAEIAIGVAFIWAFRG